VAMAVLRGLTVFAALVALAGLPCLIAWLVVSADEFAERAEDVRSRARHELDRVQNNGIARRVRRVRRDHIGEPVREPIEHIAADLRRLSTELYGEEPGSPVRRESLLRAYDERLRAACRALAVPERLAELVGFDRELERLRIEGELAAAGLIPAVGCRRRP